MVLSITFNEYFYVLTENTCPMPASLLYGTIIPEFSPVNFGGNATIVCDDGFVSLDSEIECLANGTWSAEAICTGKLLSLILLFNRNHFAIMNIHKPLMMFIKKSLFKHSPHML